MIVVSTIYATVLSLCINATDCDSYITDVAQTKEDCYTNLIVQAKDMSKVWNKKGKPLSYFLKQFHIVESPKYLADYDYTCQPLEEDEIP